MDPVELGRLGGAQRDRRLPDRAVMAERSRKGGLARAARLPRARLVQIAMLGVAARLGAARAKIEATARVTKRIGRQPIVLGVRLGRVDS